MPLQTDALLDRRRLKRNLTLWQMLAVVFLVLAIVLTVGRIVGVQSDYVARVTVTGIIAENPKRMYALRRVGRDSRAKALIVRINSPGGSVVGGEELFRVLRTVAKKKPVVAVMGSLATSAGYMAALGADHIIARHGSLTGSIGVILQSTDLTGLLEKLGIKAEAIKSAPLKAVPNPLEKLTPEGREAARNVVMDSYNMFVDIVAERRKLARAAALRLADGRVFTGRQALAAKLVDELGGEDEARRWLETAHKIGRDLPIKNRDPKTEFSLRSALRSLIPGKTVFSERLTLDGLVSLWHPGPR